MGKKLVPVIVQGDDLSIVDFTSQGKWWNDLKNSMVGEESLYSY